MLTLLAGFICLVLVPAISLAIIVNWLLRRSDGPLVQDDEFKFKI